MNLFIDHTALKPNVTTSDIIKLCEEAQRNNFYSVCVAPTWTSFAKSFFQDVKNAPKICSVISFPHGNQTLYGKCAEIEFLSQEGIQEFDVVINIGNIKSNLWSVVEDEIRTVRAAVKKRNMVLKYIIEIGMLTDEEIERVCEMLIEQRVDFVKTCTGFNDRSVTVEDIMKLKKICGDKIKIKASGGIKTAEFAKQLIQAGADRIGCSSSVAIMSELSLSRK